MTALTRRALFQTALAGAMAAFRVSPLAAAEKKPTQHQGPEIDKAKEAADAQLRSTFELRMEEVIGNPATQFVGTVVTPGGQVMAGIDDKNNRNESSSVNLAPNVRATRFVSADVLADLIATEGQFAPEQKREYAVALDAIKDRKEFLEFNPPRRAPQGVPGFPRPK